MTEQSEYFELEQTLDEMYKNIIRKKKHIKEEEIISFKETDPDGCYLFTIAYSKESHGIMIRKTNDRFDLFDPNGIESPYAKKIIIKYSYKKRGHRVNIIPTYNITPTQYWNRDPGYCGVWCCVIAILFADTNFDDEDRLDFYNFMDECKLYIDTTKKKSKPICECNGGRWIACLVTKHKKKLKGGLKNTKELIAFIKTELDHFRNVTDEWCKLDDTTVVVDEC